MSTIIEANMTEPLDVADRKWTIQDLGAVLRGLVDRETQRDKQLNKLYEVVVTGNGEASLREQVRQHNRWIANVDKLFWIGIVAVVGQFVTLFCGVLGWIYYLSRGVTP